MLRQTNCWQEKTKRRWWGSHGCGDGGEYWQPTAMPGATVWVLPVKVVSGVESVGIHRVHLRKQLTDSEFRMLAYQKSSWLVILDNDLPLISSPHSHFYLGGFWIKKRIAGFFSWKFSQKLNHCYCLMFTSVPQPFKFYLTSSDLLLLLLFK